MTDDRSDIVEKMRERYLREWKRIYAKNECMKFWEELAEAAAAAGVATWKKFSAGMSAYERKDREGAIALIEEAIALDPKFAYAWNGKGNVLDDLKRYDEALAAYEKASRSTPNTPLRGTARALSWMT